MSIKSISGVVCQHICYAVATFFSGLQLMKNYVLFIRHLSVQCKRFRVDIDSEQVSLTRF